MGRSPRMQYHCSSLLSLPGTKVTFIGYGGEPCIDSLESNPALTKIELSQPFARWSRSLWLLWAPLKVAFQFLQLMWVLLFGMARPDSVLVQNPPSIPTLAIARVVSWLRGSRLVVDWHNFGFTILSHSLGKAHPVVGVARAYERFFGAMADSHFCVTAAMRDWLKERWGIEASVLYDKAPSFFEPSSPATKHDLMSRLHGAIADAPESEGLRKAVPVRDLPSQTLLTDAAGGAPRLRPDRPAVLLSSTSWTPDEDFGILLDALRAVNAAAEAEPTRYPPFLVLVTGKGPQKAMYERRIAALGLGRVAIRTLWLEAADYPRAVGSADLGISLHVSTSGLGLPMKVVDMQGAAKPVCAVGFPCLGELVRHGQNGLVFASAAELAEQILTLFDGWPASSEGPLGPAKGGGVSDDVAARASSLSRGERAEATRAAARVARSRGGSLLSQMAEAAAVARREEDWASNWAAVALRHFAKP